MKEEKEGNKKGIFQCVVSYSTFIITLVVPDESFLLS
jgi:hypothetical protein